MDDKSPESLQDAEKDDEAKQANCTPFEETKDEQT